MREFSQKDKVELLWKIINRYDYYIGTTNSKTAIIIAFNTFIFTGITLKWIDIGSLFINYPKIVSIINLLLLIITASSLISLFFVFKAINPFLESIRNLPKYISAIFFGDVSNYNTPGDYQEKIKNIDYEILMEDLSNQTYILAKGIDKKFKYLKSSINCIIFIEIPTLILILFLKLLLIFINII